MPRLLAISDVHGHYDELIALLRFVKFRDKDTLILLGDLIDRGPKSAQIVQWVMNVQAKGVDVRVLMGNHELMLLSYMAQQMRPKDYLNDFVGGKTTIKNYLDFPHYSLDDHLRFMSTYPKTIEIGSYIFTHSGLDIRKKLNQQTFQDTSWDTNLFYQFRGVRNKTVIFGHYPTYYLYQNIDQKEMSDSRIWRDPIYKDKIGIDCGYSKSKKLACLDLTNNIEYYCTVYSKKMETIVGR